MAEEAIPLAVALPAVADSAEAALTRPDGDASEAKKNVTNGAATEGTGPAKESATEQAAPSPQTLETKPAEDTNDKHAASPKSPSGDKPASSQGGAETDDIKTGAVAPAVAESSSATVDPATPADKSKSRRKSGSVPEHKSKKLNKKASKAKMTHIDAQPGDYFMIRLKGYPLWPGIVCDESMLPNTLLKSRPVTALGKDGTYRADYADGGAKVNDRTFPVMYLHTNEFGWIPNTDLLELDFATIATVPTSMRKDLQAAHQLAAERHDLQYFKDILQNFMDQRAAEIAAKDAAKKAAKEAKKSKPRKSLSKVVVDEDEEDVEMEDAVAEQDSDEIEVPVEKTKKTKKRKAEDDAATPQRTDSVKKPKIKLTTTPKANGTATPKAAKEQSATKSAKLKTKKVAAKAKEPEEAVPKEPELSPEEKRLKKEKEILFLRHKLQKGLLTRDQEPKEEEMKQMAEFVTKLEGYADLEVSIIRATKINKVLKAILKLPSIPKEEEFNFKTRSQTLLDKWNKLLASDTPSAPTNGTSDVKTDPEDVKASIPETTNGVNEVTDGEKAEVGERAEVDATPVESKEDTDVAPATIEESKETIAEPVPVESTA